MRDVVLPLNPLGQLPADGARSKVPDLAEPARGDSMAESLAALPGDGAVGLGLRSGCSVEVGKA